MSYLKLRLIRHAESIGNTQGRMEGQSSTALSAVGCQQAQLLGDRLAQRNDQVPTHLYSSPLLRAEQTARIVLQAIRRAIAPAFASAHSSVSPLLLLIQRSEALQEIHPGIFQGLTWQEATQQYPELCDQLMRSLAWQPVPQAESPQEARARAQAWLHQLLSLHHPGDTVWAISHAGLMIQLISVILGSDRTWKLTIGHTAIFEFWLAVTDWQTLTQDRFNPEYWILKRFNDTAHLANHETP